MTLSLGDVVEYRPADPELFDCMGTNIMYLTSSYRDADPFDKLVCCDGAPATITIYPIP